jgi:carboxyl-terminal processing protease
MRRLLASFALLALQAAAQPARQPLDPIPLADELKRFVDVYSIVESESAESIPADAAIYGGAIPGLLRKLDPHSVFFDRDQFEQLKEMEKSVSKGFGSIVSVLPGRVIILQTQQGSPSAKAGLSPGDEIVAINNISLPGLGTEQLVEVLGATRQRQAQLAVRRPGTAMLLRFTLTPVELQSPSVDRVMLLAPGIGYFRISSFEGETGKQAREAVEKLGAAKLKGLVVDLRENPGGVVAAALETASLFLKPGTRVLSARGRTSEAKDIDVPKDAVAYGFRLAILIDGKSASCSEILAGAVQDNDRGVILGEPSFGKGLVQSVYPLSDNTGMALTTAFYYTPSGRSIQKPITSGTLTAATEIKSRPEYKTVGGRLVKGGGGIDPDEIVFPEPPSRFVYVLESNAAFAHFATEYLQTHNNIPADFEVSPRILGDFQSWLTNRRITPSISQWTRDRAYVTRRLQQEILNQARGVAAGDEIEVRNDPVVRRALTRIGGE